MKIKKNFRFWIIMKKSLLVIVAIALFWVVFHQVMIVYEQKKYPPLGQLVEVDGKHMHVYSKGNGENTIVLLSGLGTAAPVLDFEPLINELSKNNKVVVVENFGYGWSDLTNKERTVENIVEETRTALKKSNIKGPYILMPHSISGIYSMYYANKYPKEVRAVIGIDPTLPKASDSHSNSHSGYFPKFAGYLAPIGIIRLVSYLIPGLTSPLAEEGVYSKENLKMTKAITAWKYFNKNIVNETNNMGRNIDKTINMRFPSDMPVLLFNTEQPKVDDFYQTEKSKIVTLKGYHYIHWTRYKEMSRQVNYFTETLAAINKIN
ncbi:alpha/beta hydrolase [Peribacillus kribbensis]|uniref:alpha/beta hydrolase n=1 Tax=Peribacillus kribbensis TaxID=356658 RepID=UPI00041F1FE7|nr:alpha/beta fold hydrolase [Peribacillus kribbensis]